MHKITNQNEYSYTDSDALHHHAYILPPLLELILQHQTNHRHKLKVLDLGCDNGSLSQKVAQQGYEVVGVEDSTSGILFARQNFPQCHFLQASIYDLPYANLENAFDIVISVEVIEHLFYPRKLIQVAKKCLKDEGKLIITTPYHSYFKNFILAFVGQMDSHFTALWDGGHIKFFSVSTLSQILEEEGLEQIQFRFGGGLPYLWKSMLCSSFLTKN